MKTIGLLVTLAMPLTASAEDLRFLLTTPESIAIGDNFDDAHPLAKSTWQKRQGTRWSIEDGVLRGRESTPAYQAGKSHHRGLEPRISVPVTPDEFAARFSVRFIDGKANAIVPFVEFGHHVCRVRFAEDRIEVLAEGESLVVAESRKMSYEPGRWYHCLAEMKDGTFVIQIADGPTLLAEHESFKHPPSSGGKGLGVAGPQYGIVELDNVEIHHVKPQVAPNWHENRDRLATMTPRVIEKARERFLQKQRSTP